VYKSRLLKIDTTAVMFLFGELFGYIRNVVHFYIYLEQFRIFLFDCCVFRVIVV